MFDRFRKKALPVDFFYSATDVHSHILPGVDDGFQSDDASIAALRYWEEKGVRKIRLTPHFMMTYSENSKATITPKFEAFKKKAEASCGIELHLGAEYMLDVGLRKHLQDGFLTIDKGGGLVLCETSYLMIESDVPSMLCEMMIEGYTPIIAHPERYQYASETQYKSWKEKDYLFQLNLLSLAGAYGEPALEKSHYMLQHGMYDFVGSDMHRIECFNHFLPTMKLLTKEIDALYLLYENNARLF